MILDKDKTYKFCGDVYEWSSHSGMWESKTFNYGCGEARFQHYADGGLVEESREPREFTSMGFRTYKTDGNSLKTHAPLPEWVKPFHTLEVTIREVHE